MQVSGIAKQQNKDSLRLTNKLNEVILEGVNTNKGVDTLSKKMQVLSDENKVLKKLSNPTWQKQKYVFWNTGVKGWE